MTTCRRAAGLVLLAGALAGTPARGDEDTTLPPAPRSLEPRIEVRLVCAEPGVVTPVAIDVDDRGRAWVIESHTHHRERRPGYDGPASDRLLVVEDRGGPQGSGRVEVFARGFRHAMGLRLGPAGRVYVATRREVLYLRDTDGDGRADERRTIARLETESDYPHNGLSGLVFDGLGRLYVGMGENLGFPYRLVGSDGRTLEGGTEGGDVFRMGPDGRGLERFATGFWNAFGLAFDAFGRLFVVDNDPDSRPPCRLLHVQERGDYGYRFWLGRKGLHPFTSWNGELPGTLPMAAGTGEAPSGVVAYEHDALPARYRGALFVTSWGDHRVETFRARPHGASVRAERETLIQGGPRFRPVGIAVAPDGSVWLTDWVVKSYPVHGHGRIWRLVPRGGAERSPGPDAEPRDIAARLADPRRRVREAARDAGPGDGETGVQSAAPFREVLCSGDAPPRARRAALVALARRDALRAADVARWFEEGGAARAPPPVVRAGALELLAEAAHAQDRADVQALLRTAAGKGRHPAMRAAALLALERPDGLDPIGMAAAARDPFVESAALGAAARLLEAGALRRATERPDPRARLAALLALKRRSGMGRGFVPFAVRRIDVPLDIIRRLIADPDAAVRRAALQWAGEEQLEELQGTLDRALRAGPPTKALVDAWLASTALLEGDDPRDLDRVARDARLVRRLRSSGLPPVARAPLLRSVSPGAPELDEELIRPLVDEGGEVAIEAVRTARGRPEDWVDRLLADIARDRGRLPALRREALLGLAARGGAQDLLIALLEDPEQGVAAEAARALRTADLLDEIAARRAAADPASDREAPGRDTAAWRAGLLHGGDPRAGERLFHAPTGPRCASCHVVAGRGGPCGPGLSAIGRRGREVILDAILEPAAEVAPQFALCEVVTPEGPRAGVVLGEDSAGRLRLGTADGRVERIAPAEVLERRQRPGSLMPDGLEELLSWHELRDLIAYLASLEGAGGRAGADADAGSGAGDGGKEGG